MRAAKGGGAPPLAGRIGATLGGRMGGAAEGGRTVGCAVDGGGRVGVSIGGGGRVGRAVDKG